MLYFVTKTCIPKEFFVYFTFVPCYLVSIEKQYSGITYTQSHAWLKVCKSFNLSIDRLNMSKHTGLDYLIPQCIEIEEFERAGTSLLPAEEDESFIFPVPSASPPAFRLLWTSRWLADMKDATDLLSKYTKKASQGENPFWYARAQIISTFSNTRNQVRAIITTIGISAIYMS